MLNKKIRLLAVLGATVLAFACGDDGGDGPTFPIVDDTPVEGPRFTPALGATAVGGSAVLSRYEDRIEIAWEAEGLEDYEGHLFTLWGITFNNDSECFTTPCMGPADVKENPPVNASFYYIAAGSPGGQIITDGKATFNGTRTLAQGGEGYVLGEDGMLDTMVEQHFVIRTHGEPLTGDLLTAQHTTFNGGCLEGEPNEGVCQDILAVLFLGADQEE